MTWASNADVLARTMWGEARGEGLLGMGGTAGMGSKGGDGGALLCQGG